MPFDLKPAGSTNDKTVNIGDFLLKGNSALASTLPEIDDIVWSTPRLPPPVQLQGRVSEDEWVATFDAVRDRCAAELEITREKLAKTSPSCCPCFIFQQLSYLGELQEKLQASEQAWLSLAQAENDKYAPHGVHVTVAKEMRSVGPGRNRSMREFIVGLHFDAADAAISAIAVECTPPQAPMDRSAQLQSLNRGDDLAGQLEKLTKLYEAGALSDDEFRAAKQKALGF